MKKLVKLTIIAILSILIVFSLTACNKIPENLGENAVFVPGNDSYTMLKDFVAKYPNRTAGYKTFSQELGKEEYINFQNATQIMAEFESYGYEKVGDGIEEFKFNNQFENNRQDKGYNIVLQKKSENSDKTVVLSANYDNANSIKIEDKLIGGDGSYSSATGVVALMKAAQILADKQLPYNLVILLTDAYDYGQFGSKNYFNSLSDLEKDNLLLMVSFDKIAGGDYLYMYAEEVKMSHYNFFYEQALSQNLFLADIPNYKKNQLYVSFDDSESAYYHSAMSGDNYIFNKAGINTLTFIATNYSNFSDIGEVEMKGKPNILYTANDTISEMIARYGGEGSAQSQINKRIDSAVTVVVNGLLDDDFTTVMEESKANKFDYYGLANYKIFSYVSLGLTIGIVVLIIVLYFLLNNKAKTHPIIIMTPQGAFDFSKGAFVGQNEKSTSADDIDPFGFSTKESDNLSENKNNKNDDNNNDIFGDF